MKASPITNPLPLPHEERDWDVKDALRWAREWAMCANASSPSELPKSVWKLAAKRYLPPDAEHQHPYEIERATEQAVVLMIKAARKLIFAPLTGARFRIIPSLERVGRVQPDGTVRWRGFYPLRSTPEEALMLMLDGAGSRFPFRRCARCNTIFVRGGRREYCTTKCTRAAELERRRGDEAFKLRQRNRMRERREQQKKALAEAQRRRSAAEARKA